MSWRDGPTNIGKPQKTERIVAGLCYLSAGLVGLLYIIVSGKNGQSQFFRFHFLQAILLGIMLMLLQWTSSIIITICSGIFSLFAGIAPAVALYGPAWLEQGLTIVLMGLSLLFLYGMVFSFLGRTAEIPWVSNFIRQKM